MIYLIIARLNSAAVIASYVELLHTKTPNS